MHQKGNHMTAIVTPTSPSGLMGHAYCEPCQDGVNTSTRRARVWADEHNNDTHPGETE